MNNKRVKILFVIANANLSGAERQLLLLASHIDKTKFDPEICCLEGEGTFTDAVKESKIPLHIIQRRKSYDIHRLIGLIRLIKKEKYHIIYSFASVSNQYTRLARLFVTFKLVSGERGRDTFNVNMINFIDKILFPLSNHVVFNSSVQAKKYFAKNGKNKRVSVIFNGIDLNIFQNINQDNLRPLLDINKRTILIGTVGNFTVHKNFEMFIDVCEKIINKNSDIYFVAIGDGKNKNYYADLIKHRGLKNKLTLLGRRNDIEKVILSLDLFLLTSTWEGMPNVILEAMACEVPVISTNVDGCKEIIQNGVNGYLVDVDNVDDMVSKIMLLIKDSNLREEVVQNGLLTIKSQFLLKEMVDQYENIYQTS